MKQLKESASRVMNAESKRGEGTSGETSLTLTQGIQVGSHLDWSVRDSSLPQPSFTGGQRGQQRKCLICNLLFGILGHRQFISVLEHGEMSHWSEFVSLTK